MSKFEKQKERLFSEPKDYTYAEAKSLLIKLGCEEYNKGKTSGSAVCFTHNKSKRTIYLHKPHPSGIFKRYMLRELIAFVKEIENE